MYNKVYGTGTYGTVYRGTYGMEDPTDYIYS